MSRWLHLSDLHIGVENYGRLDPATGLHTRLLDFCRSLDAVIDAALQAGIDGTLFAGDAYRTCDPTPTQQRELAHRIARLAEAGPVVMVTGNHDAPVAFGKASSVDVFEALSVPGVTVCHEPSVVRLEGLQVACLPWLHRSRLMADHPDLDQEDAYRELQARGEQALYDLAEQVTTDTPAVLLAHLAASEATYAGSERTAVIGTDPTFDTQTLADGAFAYVALGHVHRFQDLNPGGKPPVVYAGAIDRVDFGEEAVAPGAVLVTLKDGAARYERLLSPARPFRTVRVTVPEGQDPTAWIVQALGGQDVTGAVVRVGYDSPESPDLRAIHRALEGAHVIAGVSPVPRERAIVRRAGIAEGAATIDALKAYLAGRPDLNGVGEAMLVRHGELEAELANT